MPSRPCRRPAPRPGSRLWPGRSGSARSVARQRSGSPRPGRRAAGSRCSPPSRCPRRAGRRTRSRSPNRYCRAARSGPMNGIVSSSICGSCAAHSACMFAVTPSAANRGMSSGCITCRWAMWCRWSFAPLAARGGLDGVQRLPHRAVADRVQVHLEAVRVQRGHVLAQGRRVHVGQAPVRGLAAAGVQVGLDHPGGEVLRHPVLHDLHGVRAEPACLALLPPGQDLGQLLAVRGRGPTRGRPGPGRSAAPASPRPGRPAAGRPSPGSRRRSRPARR